MAWEKRNPDLTNNPLYLEPRVTEVESQLAEIAYLVTNFKQTGDTDDMYINRALTFVNSLGGGKVRIPYKPTPYVLSSKLVIYSNTTLEVDTYANIKLANDVNCRMVENANKTTQGSLTRIDKNIKIIGGIWDGNGANQSKKWDDAPNTSSLMTGFLFSGIDHFVFKPTKIINTKTYGCLICNVNDLLIENVEVNVGNVLVPNNGDGIHILGPSENITIQNCKLHSEDNVIAINADDIGHGSYGTFGDITNVRIRNIHVNNYDGGQGLLLLSGDHAIKDVIVENITGEANYLIAIVPYDFGLGNYDNITIKNSTLQWLDSRYHYIQLNGKMGTVNLNNIKTDGYISTVDSLPIGIYAYATPTVPCTIDKLNIEDVTINGMDGLVGNHYGVYLDNQAYVKTLSINNLVSKNNAQPCIPLYLFQCRVDNMFLSNFDIDHATNGGISIIESSVSTVRYSNIVLDSTSVNEFHYVNTSVANISEVKISNCGNINVLAPEKINSLVIDHQYSKTTVPAIFGLATGGSATYSEAVGKYIQTKKVVNFQLSLSWTGHTGTGQAFIPLPFPASSDNIGYVPVTIVSNGVNITGQLYGLINKTNTYLQLYVVNGGSFTAFNVPTSGTLYIVGSYFIA